MKNSVRQLDIPNKMLELLKVYKTFYDEAKKIWRCME